jgi:uncharacterized protein DUF4157
MRMPDGPPTEIGSAAGNVGREPDARIVCRGHVRVHAGSQTAAAARAINARALTVGRDIVFGGEHYAPHTGQGRRLIADELTHTVQQETAGSATRIATKLGASAQAITATDTVQRVGECAGKNVRDCPRAVGQAVRRLIGRRAGRRRSRAGRRGRCTWRSRHVRPRSTGDPAAAGT